jgi:regulator of protease activity HflC (stomatin/prohibitin superfamily)
VASRAFGLAKPMVVVENGEIKKGEGESGPDAKKDPSALLAAFGGPGMLVVGEGNVVVLERGGKLSRILGQGTYALERGEWFKQPTEKMGIHDLRGGSPNKMTVTDVRTKDGVPLEITIGGNCKLELKSVTDARADSRLTGESDSEVLGAGTPYEIYRQTVYKAVYGSGKGGWQGVYPGKAVGALKQVVSQYTFNQIYPSPGDYDEDQVQERVIAQIVKEIGEAVKKQRSYTQGIVPGRISITEIELPGGMRKDLLERWAAPLRTEIQLQRARDQREALIIESQGRAKSFENVEEARRKSSDQWKDVIANLGRVALPKHSNDLVVLEFVRMVRELISRIGSDESVDQQQVEVLRRWMEEEERKRMLAAQVTYTASSDKPASDEDEEA